MKPGTMIFMTILLILVVGIAVYLYIERKDPLKDAAILSTGGINGGPVVPVTGVVTSPDDEEHNVQRQETSFWGNISKWWNRNTQKTNHYVQVPPIDEDGIDSRGYDINGFLVRV